MANVVLVAYKGQIQRVLSGSGKKLKQWEVNCTFHKFGRKVGGINSTFHEFGRKVEDR